MQFKTNPRPTQVFLFGESAGWRVRLAPGPDRGRKLLTLAAIVIGSSSFTLPALAAAQERATTNEYWWPNRLDLTPLRQNSPASAPTPT